MKNRSSESHKFLHTVCKKRHISAQKQLRAGGPPSSSGEWENDLFVRGLSERVSAEQWWGYWERAASSGAAEGYYPTLREIKSPSAFL
ncbi:hypothetical protein J6590_066344 [Homalodisca vitripennis]|nr:hypothetical protein J6590_066344 [Homalodisca vitripennis]